MQKVLFGGVSKASVLVLALLPFVTYANPYDAGEKLNCETNVLNSSTEATFMANWEPVIVEITLDSLYYEDGSTTTGKSVDATAVPAKVYIKYNTDVFADATAQTPIAKLTKLPKSSTYVFDGFYTGKATGGNKVVDSAGTIAVSTVKTMYTADATWYASYKPCECVKGTNVKSCTTKGTTDDNKCQYEYEKENDVYLKGNYMEILKTSKDKINELFNKKTEETVEQASSNEEETIGVEVKQIDDKVDVVDINSTSRPYAFAANNTAVAVQVQEEAEKHGFTAEVVEYGEHYDFLARIKRKE